MPHFPGCYSLLLKVGILFEPHKDGGLDGECDSLIMKPADAGGDIAPWSNKMDL